jgi:hypothetical protein
MEGETLLPLRCSNCCRMTASRELFDTSVGLVPRNALVLIELVRIYRMVGQPGPNGPGIKVKTDQEIVANSLHGGGCT